MAHELFGRVLYGSLYAARLSEVSPSVGMDRDTEGVLTRCQRRLVRSRDCWEHLACIVHVIVRQGSQGISD